MSLESCNGDFRHEPVLLDEVIELLAPHPGGLYVDCTLGGCGHAAAIMRAGAALLVGLDRDPDALKRGERRLVGFGGRFELHNERFENLKGCLGDREADGILIDLGVSSFMLDDASRGFSFRADGPLDMRMDRRQALTAADIVNGSDEGELVRIFHQYGEERYARRIARMIVRARTDKPFSGTLELARIAEAAVPARERGRIHPATRIFMALRIAVNGELEGLEGALVNAVGSLKPGGRLAVISFHSLEDRIVKRTFARLAKGCVCPPKSPVCVCGRRAQVKPVTRKPVTATEAEMARNPRSRSALLRVVEKEAA